MAAVEAVYVDEGDVITPTEFAAGPWDPTVQHGGPPAALLARAIEATQPPGAGPGPTPPPSGTTPYFTGFAPRAVAGSLSAPGRATAWFRLTRPIVAGEEPSPLMRVMAVADFANGISSLLDPRQWSFINADLTGCCHRHPAGEWVALDSQTVLSGTGIGCTPSHSPATPAPLGGSHRTRPINRST